MSEHNDSATLSPTLNLATKPTREIVTLAHLLILGTPPRNEHQIEKGIECGTVSLLRQSLLNSNQFNRHVKRGAAGHFLFFIHIPKTAGGSLRGYFKLAFGDACRWYMKNRDSDTAPIMRKDIRFNVDDHLSKYRMSGGHIPYNDIPKSLLQRDPIFLSVIRNPIDRALSHYNFIRTQQRRGRHDKLRDLTLYEALQEDQPFFKKADRIQLRFLSGDSELSGVQKVLDEHKFLIGKQEYLDDFMLSLHQMLDLPLVPAESKQIHRAQPDYIARITAQPRYEEAIEILTKINEDEFKFFNSFDRIWTNIRTRARARNGAVAEATAEE